MAETDLFDYVRADPTDREFVTECAATASSLVGERVGENTRVPAEVRAQAVLEVGANLFQRRLNRQGQPSFTDPDFMQSPHRPALDPMTPAWPLLRPYLEPGIA